MGEIEANGCHVIQVCHQGAVIVASINRNSWLSHLCPDEYYERVEAIAPERLWERGIRGLILDLDNTLVKYHEHHVNSELLRWFDRVKSQGITCCILSNNHRRRRINRIADKLGVQFVARAGKPRRRPFLTAMHMLNTDRHSTAVIGDQVFTDVLGGKRSGLYTVLIQPRSSRDFIGTRVMRCFETGIVRYLTTRGYVRLVTGHE